MITHKALGMPQKIVAKLKLDFNTCTIGEDAIYRKKWLKGKISTRLKILNPGVDLWDIYSFIELMYAKKGEI